MANEDLVRNPQTGRYYSKFESMLKQAQLAEKQHGLTETEQQLVAMEATAQDDSHAVQGYILDLVGLVRSHQDSAADLAKVVPLLLEVNQRAQKDDPSLSKGEKKRIDGMTKDLIAFARKRTALKTRAAAAVNTVVRASKNKLNALREGAADSLSNSQNPSFLFRMAGQALGKAIRPRDAGEVSGIDKELLSTRAGVLSHLVDNQKAVLANDEPAKERRIPDEFVAPVEESEPKPKKVSKRASTSKSSKGVPTEDTLDRILTVDEGILRQLEITNNLLRTGSEFALQDKQASERAQDNATAGQTTPERVVKEKKGKDAGFLGGLLGNVKDAFSGILKGMSGALGLFSKDLLKYGSVIGKAGLAVAGAVATIELGKMAEKATAANPNSLLSKSQDFFGRLAAPLFGASAKDYNDTRAARADAATRGNLEAAQLFTGTMGSLEHGLDSTLGVAAKPEERQVAPNVTKVPPSAPVAAPSISPTRATPPSQMDVSSVGIEFIKRKESFSPVPYEDPKGSGEYAIGYGSHTWKGQSVTKLFKSNPKLRITQQEADADMKRRLDTEFVPVVRQSLTRPVSQPEFDSLVSIAWNRGTGAFQKDKKFLGKVNSGTATVADFRAAHGNHLSERDRMGIESRRAEEYAMFVRQPSAGRAAGPIAELSNATRSQSAPTVVVAAPSVSTGGNGSAVPSIIPQPMKPENGDASLKALKSANVI